uniref:Uncharacterized protein n=1 Tax=Anguilla anguilla TaxID=7936 RepID=A0A0E9R0S7_ANGAN
MQASFMLGSPSLTFFGIKTQNLSLMQSLSCLGENKNKIYLSECSKLRHPNSCYSFAPCLVHCADYNTVSQPSNAAIASCA